MTIDWEEIERKRRGELDVDRLEDFIERWGPEDPCETSRFASELSYLLASHVEHRTNTITRMYAAAVALTPNPLMVRS